jgi:EAL domain-containing protein (putative c-di-GMP-specific phosphodiesterase class I)
MNSNVEDLVLLVDDDFSVRTAIAAALERPNRTIITCADYESAQILLELLPINTAIADLRLSGPFGSEGLDLISFAADKQPGARVVLISGHASQELQREAAARGAVALLRKPFAIDEIEAVMGSEPDDRAVDGSHIIDMPSLDVILLEQRLSNAFQPIVNRDGEVFGYESLARVSNDAPLNDPTILFQYAERKRRLFDLEMACVKSTFLSAQAIPQAVKLFINIHPHALALGRRFSAPFIAVADQLAVPLSRIVLEITEQAQLRDDGPTNEAIAELRDRGASFAFDDVGIAHSHYVDLNRVKPSFFKVSNHFGTDFERDATRSRIVRNIVSLADDFGIDVILEGVESEATAHAATHIGVRYLQGYWFGKPVEASQLGMAQLAGVN